MVLNLRILANGHGTNFNDFGYVCFKVTRENFKQLQQLGKVLSHKGVSTNFDYHDTHGFSVQFSSFKATDRSWFNEAAETLRNPPDQEIVPSPYYHEPLPAPSKPLSQKIKQSIIDALKKWRIDSEHTQSSTPAPPESQKTFSQKLKDEYAIGDLCVPKSNSVESANRFTPESNINANADLGRDDDL